MISIVPFEPWHAAAIAVQRAQAPELAAMSAPPGAPAALGPAFSALEVRPSPCPLPRAGEGEEGPPRVLCCAGLIVNNPSYATAWALFACDKGGGMVAVTRAIRRVLAEADFRRVDMMVRAGFRRAADFAAMIGFYHEATLGELDVDGGDYEVWRLRKVSPVRSQHLTKSGGETDQPLPPSPREGRRV